MSPPLASDAQRGNICQPLLEADNCRDEVVNSVCDWRKPNHASTGDQQIAKGQSVQTPVMPMGSIGASHRGLPLGTYTAEGH